MTMECVEDGCDVTATCRGLCVVHYNRKKRSGMLERVVTRKPAHWREEIKKTGATDKTTAILRAAMDLLSDPARWRPWSMILRPGAYDLVEAIYVAARGIGLGDYADAAYERIACRVRWTGDLTPVRFNDKHTHAQVMRLFNEEVMNG